jgi:hypothetical protein
MDGWAYCLRLDDGVLVWKTRLAPGDLRTIALQQVESLWPVHGSLLVKNGLVYATAGRSSYLDGGIYLYALNPETGEVVHRNRLRSTHMGTEDNSINAPDHSEAFVMDGAISDVLVSDGKSIFMKQIQLNDKLERQQAFGRHLYSTSRLLDPDQAHRSHWLMGNANYRGIGVSYSWSLTRSFVSPSGMIMAFTDKNLVTIIHGLKNSVSYYELRNYANTPFNPSENYFGDFVNKKKEYAVKPPERRKVYWEQSLDIHPYGLIQSGDTIVTGGSLLSEKGIDDKLKKGSLVLYSAESGAVGNRIALSAPPVFSGMAAAYQSLYVSLKDGSIVCVK